MKRFTVVAVWLLMAITLSAPAATNDVVLGDMGNWRTFWHGVGDSQGGELPRSCPIVINALKAAEMGNFSHFCSYFSGVDTNQAPQQVKMLYRELNLYASQYSFLIAQEAVLQDSQGRLADYAALSIVPSTLKSSGNADTNLQEIGAVVIFSRRVSDGWVLLAHSVDAKLLKEMTETASRFAYRPTPLRMEAVERDIHKFHSDVLEAKRRAGASDVDIVSTKESFRVMENAGQITNWQTWSNYYHAVVLDPAITFDLRDNILMDFSKPVTACCSYLRAAFLHDDRALLENADESGVEWLKKGVLKEKTAESRARGGDSAKLTHITMLLTATVMVDEKSYVMVLWRSQNAERPKAGLIGFQRTFFVYNPEKKSYLLTRDVAQSTFGALLPIAGAPNVGLSVYNDFYKKMAQSEFPEHFYSIR